jgi:hypothetical protein
MSTERQKELLKLYRKTEQTDVFGRRPARAEEITGRRTATPAEIRRMTRPSDRFEYMLDNHLPSDLDIEEKGD